MSSHLPISVLLAAHTASLGQYWHKLTDKTFTGIYHANFFDLAMMIPYFIVLFVLALYGMHRYWLVYDYYAYSKNVPGPTPEVKGAWPRVTVQLPIFNERYVIERLVEAVSRFDYPRELLDVQVLDDSTDETRQVASDVCERFAAQGLDITYIHRSNRAGYKAGALENGLKTSRGDFVAIFDADFIPEADFLRRTIPYFQNKGIGMVQTRWTYLNRDYSLLTQVETILLDGHFVVEHGARSRRGTFFNFNGTAGVWRRTAIDEAGGWQHDTLTEDTDLSYRAQLRGWKFLYLPNIECASELPIDMNGFKAQQARWAKGLMQTAKKILPRVFASDAPWLREGGGVFSSDGEHQLSADGAAVDDAAAGDDRAVLSGLAADDCDRFAAVSGFDVLDFEFLSGGAKRIAAEELVANIFVYAVCDGDRHRDFGAQRASGDRGDHRKEKRVCADAEIQDRREERYVCREEIPE